MIAHSVEVNIDSKSPLDSDSKPEPSINVPALRCCTSALKYLTSIVVFASALARSPIVPVSGKSVTKPLASVTVSFPLVISHDKAPLLPKRKAASLSGSGSRPLYKLPISLSRVANIKLHLQPLADYP